MIDRKIAAAKRWMMPVMMIGLSIIAGCVPPPPNTSGRVTVHGKSASVSVAFNESDHKIIRDYYQKSPKKKLPPGLAKKGKIPPGHQKKLARNNALPPNQAWQTLPRDLEVRLNPLPSGYVRIRVDGSVAIMNAQTRVIYDVIQDI